MEGLMQPSGEGGIVFETPQLWVLKAIIDEKQASSRANSLVKTLGRIRDQIDAELLRRGEHPNRVALHRIAEGGP